MKKEEIVRFYLSYRLYIFPIIVVLSSVFLIIFAIYPQTAKLISNQQASDELISKSKILESKVIALESYNVEDLSKKMSFALSALPAEKDFGYILGLLQRLASDSGFSITSIYVGNTTGKVGSSESFDVKLEMKGIRALSQNLLDSLENSPRIIRVNSIDISSAQAAQTINITLGLEVLYSRLPQKLGKVDAPLAELNQEDEQLLITLAKGGRVTTPSTPQGSRGKPNPFE